MYIVNNEVQKYILTGSDIDVIKVDGEYVYYIENSKVKRVSIENGAVETVTGGDKTVYTTNKNLIDITGKYVYVLTQYTAEDASQHYYLNRINTHDVTDSSMTGEFVGSMLKSHVPAAPTQSEEVETDEIIPWV